MYFFSDVTVFCRQVGRCFVVFYGREFNLKSLSVVALSETECDYWIKGLACLIQVHNLNISLVRLKLRCKAGHWLLG